MPRTSPYKIELSPQDSQEKILSLEIAFFTRFAPAVYTAFVYFSYHWQAGLPLWQVMKSIRSHKRHDRRGFYLQ
jgi:hypothetical protein